tara:strand:+ start:3509 stop:4024 length:516 start_codon:yes stop_codon:yes gene_type:complete
MASESLISRILDTQLFNERGRWIVLTPNFDSNNQNIYIDLNKGIAVFHPRCKRFPYKLSSFVNCTLTGLWHLNFSHTEGSDIQIKIPYLTSQDQVVEYFEFVDSYACGIRSKRLISRWNILNYTNQSNDDELDENNVASLNQGVVPLDLSFSRKFWRKVLRKLQREHRRRY